jgi:MSHA biogenesis protein MshO
MKQNTKSAGRENGFTLIEAVMVIVITGILVAVVASFIARPVQGYVDTVRRASLADEADVALRQMVREVRLALPNSLRVTTQGGIAYLEFIPTRDGGRYRDSGDGSTGGNNLDFESAASLDFDVLGPMVSPVAAGDFVVVYNLGEGYAPADAYAGGNRATIDAVAGNTITLVANVYTAQSPPLPSPNSRFQLVDGNIGAVTYACPVNTSGNLVRHWGYGFNPTQTVPPGGTTAVAAQNATCSFDYQPGAQRAGLLSVQLTITDTPSGEQVTVFQQIHVDNSP